MSDYISREDAKNYVIGRYDDQLGFITMEDIIDQLDYVPAADVRPVVRCRECYYWESGENPCEKWEYCSFHRINIGPHSFCSYGERKEDSNETD